MILDESQALKILEESKRLPKWVEEAREYHEELSALIDGKEFKTLLSKIEHIEKSEDKWRARQKYSRSIKDLNKRLFEPIENVYSATGGSKEYLIENEKNNAELITAIRKCRGNQSLEKWLQNNWKKVYHTDPQGVIFLETNDNDPRKGFPTYKSIDSIRNYEDNDGQNLEWILFEPKKVTVNGEPIEIIRLVDDETDWRLKKVGDSYTQFTEPIAGIAPTFKHMFGKCPGVINSDIKEVGSKKRLSPIDDIIEIQKEYLRDQSILTIVKFLNGFKNLVRPKVLCPSCHGTKKSGDGDCKACDATGFLINKDITDEIILPIDITNPDVNIPNANELANWIGLDVETWDQYRKELEIITVICQETQWGSHQSKTNTNKTATEIWVNTQPVINALNRYSDVAEFVEWQITEFIANNLIPTRDKSQRASVITYGRRYILDTPDQLLTKYLEAKEKEAPTTILDRILSEYITAKFKNDPIQLHIELIKLEIEPWPHYTVKQVNDIYGQESAQIKMSFGDWWETLDVNGIDAEKAKEDFKKYFNQKIKTNVGNQSMQVS